MQGASEGKAQRPAIRVVAAEPATSSGASLRWLLAAPHRLFFCAGMTGLLLVSLWWLVQLLARALGAPLPAALPPTWVHAWAMANAFMPFFMFGFLFTAGPKWLHVEPPQAADLRWPAAASLAGVPLVLAAAHLGAGWAIAGIVLMLGGWTALLARFAALLLASRFPDRVHAKLVLVFFAIGAAAQLLYAWGFASWSANAQHSAQMLSVWLFLVPVFLVVAHRLIPFFTASVIPTLDAWRPLWLLWTFIAIVVGHALLPLAQLAVPAIAAPRLLIDAAGGALLLYVTWRWGVAQSLANRLLAMLHLSFVWLGIALLLYAWQQAALLLGAPQLALGLAPLHATTMGFCGALMFAMVTRVSAGHSGRPLLADPLTWRLYWTLQLATLVRIAGEATPLQGAWTSAAAIALWCAALVPWSLRNLSIYLRPRADGRPG